MRKSRFYLLSFLMAIALLSIPNVLALEAKIVFDGSDGSFDVMPINSKEIVNSYYEEACIRGRIDDCRLYERTYYFTDGANNLTLVMEYDFKERSNSRFYSNLDIVDVSYDSSSSNFRRAKYILSSTGTRIFQRYYQNSDFLIKNTYLVRDNITQKVFYDRENNNRTSENFAGRDLIIELMTRNGKIIPYAEEEIIEECLGSCFSQKLFPNTPISYESFGNSVSHSGDYAIIGSFTDYSSGAAYIFKKNSNGEFEQTQRLVALDSPINNYYFGASVFISGDYAIVGSVFDDDSGYSSGAAYIFKKNSNGQFEQTQKLTAFDSNSMDYFGASVFISGDYAIVGSVFDDDSGYSSGAAYIFKKNSNGQFEQTQKLIPEQGSSNALFGSSISLSDGYLVIGSSYIEPNLPGAAYIFKKNSNGQFEQTQKISSLEDDFHESFANSLSISGNYLVVGSYREGSDFQGAAYIFKKNSNGQFEQTQKLVSSDLDLHDQFGENIVLSGDSLVISSRSQNGAAYIFKKNSNGQFEQTQKLRSFSNQTYDRFASTNAFFGNPISIDDKSILIGAYGDNTFGPYSGAAYFYEF